MLLGLAGGVCAEQITELQLTVPAAEPFQALFLFVELREREFLFSDLPVEFGLVLGAFADEFRPLFFAAGGEQLLETGSVAFVAAVRLQEERLARAALNQLDGTLEALL